MNFRVFAGETNFSKVNSGKTFYSLSAKTDLRDKKRFPRKFIPTQTTFRSFFKTINNFIISSKTTVAVFSASFLLTIN